MYKKPENLNLVKSKTFKNDLDSIEFCFEEETLH